MLEAALGASWCLRSSPRQGLALRLIHPFPPALGSSFQPTPPRHSQTRRGMRGVTWKDSPMALSRSSCLPPVLRKCGLILTTAWGSPSGQGTLEPAQCAHFRLRPAEAPVGRCSLEAGGRPGRERSPGLHSEWPWLPPQERVAVSQGGTKASLQSQPHPWAGPWASWF